MSAKIYLAVVLLAMFLASGCATVNPAVQQQAVASGTPQKVPLQYVCQGCGRKIKREAVDPNAFISKCPYCGKSFLAM